MGPQNIFIFEPKSYRSHPRRSTDRGIGCRFLPRESQKELWWIPLFLFIEHPSGIDVLDGREIRESRMAAPSVQDLETTYQDARGGDFLTETLNSSVGFTDGDRRDTGHKTSSISHPDLIGSMRLTSRSKKTFSVVTTGYLVTRDKKR